MRLQTFAILVLIVMLGLFTGLSYSIIRFSNLLDQEAGQLEAAGESIRLAQSLKARLLTHNRNAFLFALNQDPDRRESTRLLIEEINELFVDMSRLAGNAEERTILAVVEQRVDRYLSERRRLEAMALSPTEQYEQVSQTVDDATVDIDRLIDLNRAQMTELLDDVNRQNARVNSIALWLLGSGGLVLLGLLALVIMLVAWPLTELSHAIAGYGEGSRAGPIPPRGLREIRHITRNFNEMGERLEERKQEQLRIVSLIAHDLRNPLHAISLAIAGLTQQSTGEGRRLAELIGRQVDYLDQLLGDFLEASRIEAGRLELDLRVRDLRPLIRDAAQLHRNSSQKHVFVIQLPDQPLTGRCDGRRLTQVVNNLLSNAVKYSPRGGEIKVWAGRQGEELCIAVSDQGLGVAPGEEEAIFVPFNRANASKGAYPGLGLGLSSSRRIVEGHGGRMTVESQPGEGSTFFIHLPAAVAEERD